MAAKDKMEEDKPEENEMTENIIELGRTEIPATSKNPKGNIQFLTIIGQIEGHMVSPPQNKTTKYEHVIPQLVLAAENPEVDGMLVLLNTVGGDVEAGLAISELIANLGKPTVSLVIGGGHSIGVPLAVASKYSYIAPSATMTIHPIRMTGLVVGAQQTFDYFEKMQQRVQKFIVDNSKISDARLTELMTDTANLLQDIGTILIGKEAVKEGLIDEVGGLHQSMDKLYEMIKMNKAETKPKTKTKRSKSENNAEKRT